MHTIIVIVRNCSGQFSSFCDWTGGNYCDECLAKFAAGLQAAERSFFEKNISIIKVQGPYKKTYCEIFYRLELLPKWYSDFPLIPNIEESFSDYGLFFLPGKPILSKLRFSTSWQNDAERAGLDVFMREPGDRLLADASPEVSEKTDGCAMPKRQP